MEQLQQGQQLNLKPLVRSSGAQYLALVFLLLLCLPASAKVLQGRVEEENFRLPSTSNRNRSSDNSMRLTRTTRGSYDSSAGIAATFNQVLPGHVQHNFLPASVVQSQDFAETPKNFNIGAERGSRELLLAWERWHHQLSKAIYDRWSDRANTPGKATIQITVTKNHIIMPVVKYSTGNNEFRRTILAAIESLNGNPGLTFPAKSQRQQVSFEADYVAAADVSPGYTWVRNDYEKVRQEY